MADLFNNPTNNYVNPDISPCQSASDDMFLEFVKDGLGIVSGKDIIEKIDFSDLKVNVTAYTKQTKILAGGELFYLQGLTKKPQEGRQFFEFPVDSSLDLYNDVISVSISVLEGFREVTKGLTVTGDEELNTRFIDALNLELSNLKINVKSFLSEDEKYIIFEGINAGYIFNINSVVWNDIDLVEDKSQKVDFVKYPNGAVQSIVLKTEFPVPTPECPYDRYLLINHVDNPIIKYDKVDINNFISSAESYFDINFDPNTEFECGISESSVGFPEVVINPFEEDIQEYLFNKLYINLILSPFILSNRIDGSTIDNELLEDLDIYNSNISNSSVTHSNLTTSILLDSLLKNVYANEINGNGLVVEEGSLENSTILSSNITGSKLLRFNLETDSTDNSNNISYSIIEDAKLTGSILHNINGAYLNISISNITESEIYNSILNNNDINYSSIINTDINNNDILNTTINNSNIVDSNLNNVKVSLNLDRLILGDTSSFTINNSVINNSYIRDYIIRNSHVNDTTLYMVEYYDIDSSDNNIIIQSSYVENGNSNNNQYVNSKVNNVVLNEDYLYNNEVVNSTINDSLLLENKISNTIIISSDVTTGELQINSLNNDYTNVIATNFYYSNYDEFKDSSIVNSTLKYTHTINTNIINTNFFESYINNNSNVNGGYIKNSFINYLPDSSIYNIDPDASDNEYEKVVIKNAEIWDSSLRNVELIDCSIYRCNLDDVSINGCNIINSEMPQELYMALKDNNRIILYDPSINTKIELTFDSSTYYSRKEVQLDPGCMISNDPTKIGASEYLQYVSDNDYWYKFKDMYVWISPPDCNTSPQQKNLINGFYVLNPHDFDIKLEYMLTVAE